MKRKVLLVLAPLALATALAYAAEPEPALGAIRLDDCNTCTYAGGGVGGVWSCTAMSCATDGLGALLANAEKPRASYDRNYWEEQTAPRPARRYAIPVGLLWLPGYTSHLGWAEPGPDPAIDLKVAGTLALEAGFAVRHPGGAETRLSLVYVREDLSATSVVPDFPGAVLTHSGDENRLGLALGFSVPLR